MLKLRRHSAVRQRNRCRSFLSLPCRWAPAVPQCGQRRSVRVTSVRRARATSATRMDATSATRRSMVTICSPDDARMADSRWLRRQDSRLDIEHDVVSPRQICSYPHPSRTALNFIAKRSSALMDRDDITEEDIALKLAEWRTEKATLNRALLGAQERQRAEANATGAGEHIQAVRRLCAMATSVDAGQERADARAEINGALRAIIDSIALAPGETMIWIGGGAKVTVISAEDGAFSGYSDVRGNWLWRKADGHLSQHAADPLIERYAIALANRFPDRRAMFIRRYT